MNCTNENPLDRQLSTLLISIGIMPNRSGYYLLKDAVLLTLNGLTLSTCNTYSYIARQYNKSPASIERNIRSAITQAFQCGKLKTLNAYMGASIVDEKYCLTNGELIFLLVEIHMHSIKGASIALNAQAQ